MDFLDNFEGRNCKGPTLWWNVVLYVKIYEERSHKDKCGQLDKRSSEEGHLERVDREAYMAELKALGCGGSFHWGGVVGCVENMGKARGKAN